MLVHRSPFEVAADDWETAKAAVDACAALRAASTASVNVDDEPLCTAAKQSKELGVAACDAVPATKAACLNSLNAAVGLACGRRARRDATCDLDELKRLASRAEAIMDATERAMGSGAEDDDDSALLVSSVLTVVATGLAAALLY
jgi:hypothetical protein